MNVINTNNWFGASVVLGFDFWDSVRDLFTGTVYTPSNSAFVDSNTHELVCASATSDFVDIGVGQRVTANSAFTILVQFTVDAYNNLFPGVLALRSSGLRPFVLFVSQESTHVAISFGSRSDGDWGAFRTGYQLFPSGIPVSTNVSVAITYNGGDPTLTGSFIAAVNGSAQTITTNTSIATSTNTESKFGISTDLYGDFHMQNFALANTNFTSGQLIALTNNPEQWFLNDYTKPNAPYNYNASHPSLSGCTIFLPFVDHEKENLRTSVAVTDIGLAAPLATTNDSKAVWQYQHDVGGRAAHKADVSNGTSFSVVCRAYRHQAAMAEHDALYGTIALTPTRGLELAVDTSGDVWWAHGLNFDVHLTGYVMAMLELYHFGFIYDETSGMKLFMDKELIATDATTGAQATDANTLELGSRGDEFNQLFGSVGMEYLYLFDRAITDQEYLDLIFDPYISLRDVPAVAEDNAIFHSTDF